MEILGVGPLEIVVVLVIALLVFGPDKLPEIGAKMGKAVRELRSLSREITQGVDTARTAITGPVEELSRPFKDATQAVQDVAQVAESMRNPGATLERALVSQLASPTPPVPETENTIAPPSPLAPPPELTITADLAAAPDSPAEPVAAPPPELDVTPQAAPPVSAVEDVLLSAQPAVPPANWEI